MSIISSRLLAVVVVTAILVVGMWAASRPAADVSPVVHVHAPSGPYKVDCRRGACDFRP